MGETTQETGGKPQEPTLGQAKPVKLMGLERADLELGLWVIAGFVIGAALKVTTTSTYIIAAVVLAAILRLYLEKERSNPRRSLSMVPLFLGGWGLGLLIRALVS